MPAFFAGSQQMLIDQCGQLFSLLVSQIQAPSGQLSNICGERGPLFVVPDLDSVRY